MTRTLLMCMPDIYQTWSELHIIGPSLGLTSIAANSPNHEVYSADLVLKRNDVKEGIKEAIEITNPQIIGLSAMTFQYPTATRIAKHIKEEYPGIPVALGGYHATSMREEITASEQGQAFDFIFAGESEHTFNQFLDSEKLENISGLSFRDNGNWVHNPRHPAICIKQGLDSVKPPKRDSRIWEGYHFYSRPFDTAESSRGCDYACKFCSMRAMMPQARYNAFSLERVIKDIKSARTRGVKSIFFTDDNPAMHPEQFKKFLRRIKKEKLDDIYYSGMVSTKSMSDFETTKLMREAGWDFVFLGVENIYKNNLKEMRKASSEKLAAKSIDNLHNSQITTMAGIIVGNPDDTEETIRGNFQWFNDHPVDSVLPQYLTPYPGTVTRKELLKEGLIINLDEWKTYNGEFAQCKTRSGLMPEDIETIVYEEHTRFNLNRFKKLISNKLIFPKNNLYHTLYSNLFGLPPAVINIIKNIGLNSSEKAKLEHKRKIKMNLFNV